MALSEAHKRYLRGLAHHRKPVVIVGANGLTDAVVEEIDAALAHHELIKVRVNAADRDARQAMIAEMADRTGAEVVQTIGHIAALFRPGDRQVIQLPG